MVLGRIVIGGPSNSGKSAFAVILRGSLNQVNIHTFHKDYDPFSPTREYSLKEISEEERKSLKKIISENEAVEMAKEFNNLGSDYELLIGDLPGTVSKTTSILASGGTHAIILCSNKKLDEKNDWVQLFQKIKIPVICILESNQNGTEEICDGPVITGKLSNLDRDNIPSPPYSDTMIRLATAIGEKISLKIFK